MTNHYIKYDHDILNKIQEILIKGGYTEGDYVVISRHVPLDLSLLEVQELEKEVEALLDY